MKKLTINKNHAILRYSILISVLIYTTWQIWAHGAGDKSFPSVHGLCPFGGLESLYVYLWDGSTLGKIFSGTMAMFFTVIVLGIFFKRAFCGLICPLGTLQEAFGNFGRLIFKKRLTVPKIIDKPLRFLKYIVLFVSVMMAWLTGMLWFQIIDPWAAYGHLLKWEELTTAYFIGFIVLVVSLIGSFFYERFFCKYMCPMGAFTAIVGRLGLTKIYRRKKNKDVDIHGLSEIGLPGIDGNGSSQELIQAGISSIDVNDNTQEFNQIELSGIDENDSAQEFTQAEISAMDVNDNAQGFNHAELLNSSPHFDARDLAQGEAPENGVYGESIEVSRTKKDNSCIDCGLCTRACPVNIDVAHTDVIKTNECIDCGKCVAACPVPGALEHRLFGKKIPILLVVILSAVLYFGAIFVLQVVGMDRYAGGAEMTLRETAKQMNITNEQFKEMFGLPENLSNRASITEIQSLIPISIIAQQNGLSVSELKTLFELPEDLPDTALWEPTLDTVPARVIAASMGIDFETFHEAYQLEDTVTAETPYGEFRQQMEPQSSAEGGSAHDSCD